MDEVVVSKESEACGGAYLYGKVGANPAHRVAYKGPRYLQTMTATTPKASAVANILQTSQTPDPAAEPAV